MSILCIGVPMFHLKNRHLLNWVWRYFHEYHYSQIIVWTCGVVQTALYCDFFYNYFMAKRRGVDAPVKIAALPV